MISDVYFPRVNGVSTSIRTFRRDLESLGCSCWLVAPEYPGAWDDGSSIVRVPSRYLVVDPEDRVMSVRAAVRACRELPQPFDVVHVHTPFAAHYAGLRFARPAGVPIVESYHTYFEEYFHHYCRWLPRSWLRSLARTISHRQCDVVDAVVAPTALLAEILRGYGIGSRIDVIPTGLNLREFSGGDGARFRARFGIDPARPVMLHVGRAAFEKNIVFLIDVLERVRRSIADVLLVIAGEGPALNALRRDVSERGLDNNVLFVGYLDRRDALLDCYRAANVFTFASRTETQGLVVLEALALGVPVVSTAILGTREVLAGARGALIVDEDLEHFADAVTRVLIEPALQRQLADAAQAHVRDKWSSEQMALRMLRLYERLAGASRGAEPLQETPSSLLQDCARSPGESTR
jgi:glycosyltransferase involved in cell wall biosynthesis